MTIIISDTKRLTLVQDLLRVHAVCVVVLQCHFIKFNDNAHTVMETSYTLRRIEESDIPFLYELFHDSEVTKLMSHSFQTENDAREYFVFISGVNEEGSEPGKVYLILNGMSAPVGIVGFDYILGPTAYLVFALLPEYWGRGIMHRALQEFLQKHGKPYRNIIARVKDCNKPALKLIQKLPFRIQIELLKSSNF